MFPHVACLHPSHFSLSDRCLLLQSNSLALTHPSERQLGLHLVRFAEVSTTRRGFRSVFLCFMGFLDVFYLSRLPLYLLLWMADFAQVVEDSVTNFLPNALCEYLYSLAGMYTEFYTNCKVHLRQFSSMPKPSVVSTNDSRNKIFQTRYFLFFRHLCNWMPQLKLNSWTSM